MTKNKLKRSFPEMTICIFDVFFDMPHPEASASCERAKVIDPPWNPRVIDASDLYEPMNIARIARYAFPDCDGHNLGERYLHT